MPDSAAFQAGSAPVVAAAIMATALVGFAVALGRLRRAERVDAQAPRGPRPDAPWWHGYLRDLTNLLMLLGSSVALGMSGFAPPLALLGGFFLTLAVYIVDWLLGRALRVPAASWVAAGLGGVVAALVLTHAAATATQLSRLLAWLF
jgi:hypothetical protein